MSTFAGRFPALPGISADRFDGDNRNSSVFFLSHCHTDHMIGLEHDDGLPGPLYLSDISALIAKRLYPNPKIWDQSVILEVGQPTVVSYTSGEDQQQRRLTVTAIPAGHCPGSVMFMLEMDDKRILYTGDFRLSTSSLRRLNIFQDVPRIDVAYVDSTFFSRRYKCFPNQRESAKVIGRLITEWLQQHPTHKIALHLSARYGYEYLFVYLYQALGISIHVNQEEAEKYRYIPEMDRSFCSDSKSTRVHACFGQLTCKVKRAIPCDPSANAKQIRVIKPSAMIWSGWTSGEPIHRMEDPQYYRVCYSNHASWSELRDMFIFLRPVEIRLNVLPTDGASRSEMMTELRAIQSEYKTEVLTTTSCRSVEPILEDHVKWIPANKMIDAAAEDSDDEPPMVPVLKRRRIRME